MGQLWPTMFSASALEPPARPARLSSHLTSSLDKPPSPGSTESKHVGSQCTANFFADSNCLKLTDRHPALPSTLTVTCRLRSALSGSNG